MLFLMNTKAAVILGCLPPRLGKRVIRKAVISTWLAGRWLAPSKYPVYKERTVHNALRREFILSLAKELAISPMVTFFFFFNWNVLSSQFCVSAQLHTCLSSLYKVECQKCLGWDSLKVSDRKWEGKCWLSLAVLL